MPSKSAEDSRKGACRRFQNGSCAVLLALNFKIQNYKTLRSIWSFVLKHAIPPMRFCTFTKSPRKWGVGKRDPRRVSALSWGGPRRILDIQKCFPRRPQRPPIDVGRRLEEVTAESRFLLPFSSNIALFDVGRALEVTLDT